MVEIRDPDISAVGRELWSVTVFICWDWGGYWGADGVATVAEAGAGVVVVVGNEIGKMERAR